MVLNSTLSALQTGYRTTQDIGMELSLIWKCVVLNCAYSKCTCGQRSNLSQSFIYVAVKTGPPVIFTCCSFTYFLDFKYIVPLIKLKIQE